LLKERSLCNNSNNRADFRQPIKRVMLARFLANPFDFPATTTLELVECRKRSERLARLSDFELSFREAIMSEPLVLEVFSDFV
jgi:hypothetical protein